jgi:Tol biopolymer transport system component
VSFRDPLGVLSPDGEFLAWSVQHHLYVRRVNGGPIRELATEPGLILHLAWLPDSRGIIAEHRDRTPRWWKYQLLADRHGPLFPPGQRAGPAGPLSDSLRQYAIAGDGRMAAVQESGAGSALWLFGGVADSAEVIHSKRRLSFPFFAPDGHLACMARDDQRQLLRNPCGGVASALDVEAYGPAAFSRGGDSIYYAAPNAGGTLDLWVEPTRSGGAVRLTNFSRDAYAPTVAATGRALFKLQNYRTVVGVMADTGGLVTPIADFQSETPSWDPTGKWIGITHGTWRRVIDDFRYPDIAQDAGIISADPGDSLPHQPVRIVDASPSEDQSMTWSPNGKWIVYHSHKDQGDDLYLVPADRSQPARRITTFGRGFETGWPRWSPDGKWLAFDADSRDADRKSVIYVIGIDQESGVITAPERALAFEGFSGEAIHAEWLGDSDRIAVLGVESADRQLIFLGTRSGGPMRVLHRYQSEHLFSGIGTSPDGKWIAFVAPDAGQYFQIFRIPATGGGVQQLTFDPTNKTQPAYSPDGHRIALTVWEYAAHFFLLR